MEIEGIGALIKRDGFWEVEPSNLNGATIYVDSEFITSGEVERVKEVSESWQDILDNCLEYIESKRQEYTLEASIFENPNVFVSSLLEWGVYFDVINESEDVVGVEFIGNKPLQLVVGE